MKLKLFWRVLCTVLGLASGLLSVVWVCWLVVVLVFGLVVRLGADLQGRVGAGKLVKLLRSEDTAVWLCLVPVAPVV